MGCRCQPDIVTVINGPGHIPALSLGLFHLQGLLSLPQPAPTQGSRAHGKHAAITTMETLGGNQNNGTFSATSAVSDVLPPISTPSFVPSTNLSKSLQAHWGFRMENWHLWAMNLLLQNSKCVSYCLQNAVASSTSSWHFSFQFSASDTQWYFYGNSGTAH